MERLSRLLHRRKTTSSSDATAELTSPPPPPPPAPQTQTQTAEKPPSRRKSRHSLRLVPRTKTVSSSNARPTRPPRRESQQNVELPPPAPSASTTAVARAAAAAAMSSAPQNIDADAQKLFADFGPMSPAEKRNGLNDGPLAYRRRDSDHARQRRSSAQATPQAAWPLTDVYGSSSHAGQVPASPTRQREHSLTRKSSVKHLRPTSPTTKSVPAMSAVARTTSLSPHSNSSSIHKPLPKSPSDEFEQDLATDRVIKHDSGVEKEIAAKRQQGVYDAKAPIDLGGVVNLSDTEDTVRHETWAPAVTHETITRNVHENRQEVITRQIHTHDVYHRVLPVIDFEVLPARHFVPVQGGYMEISADEVPAGAGSSAQELIERAIANLTLGTRDGPIIPNRFSARTFEGSEGDYREYTGPDGIQRTEQWWVHPPTVSSEPYEGKSTRIQLGAPASMSGGLTGSLASNVVGVSPLLAEQRRQRG